MAHRLRMLRVVDAGIPVFMTENLSGDLLAFPEQAMVAICYDLP